MEQWYAVHKKTGKVFKSSSNTVCFNTEAGLKTAINSKEGMWMPSSTGRGWHLTDTPVDNFILKRIVLT